MAMAKVWNDGPTDYTEDFRGDKIMIPRGKSVEMDQFDAVAFLGQYIPVRKNDIGGLQNHKQLRMELVADAAPAKPVEHRCQLCKGAFQTENELLMHSDAYHKDVQIDDKKAKK